MQTEIRMPKLRPEMKKGMLAAWLKEEGERLRQELVAMQRGLAAPGEG